jgi:hypothetical protein
MLPGSSTGPTGLVYPPEGGLAAWLVQLKVPSVRIIVPPAGIEAKALLISTWSSIPSHLTQPGAMHEPVYVLAATILVLEGMVVVVLAMVVDEIVVVLIVVEDVVDLTVVVGVVVVVAMPALLTKISAS